MEQAIQSVQSFFKRKDVVISAHRYGIDAMGAMAQGLFASLLIGTIIKTLGQQLGLAFLVTAGGYAAAVAGPAMAASIGYALHAPQLVLFSLIAVGGAANELGGAGGPLAVYLIAIIAAEVGKLVSKETKIDILVTPAVTILVGVSLSALFAPSIGAVASAVGSLIMWATELQPLLMGIVVSVLVGMALTLPISSAAICAALGLTGLEFACGIPGTVGGAVYMNAGAYGNELKDVLESVTFLDSDLQLRTLPAADLAMGYRTSIFEQNPDWCILSATVVLHRGDGAAVLARMQELLGKRREKQPLEWPSAGSTFKRPQGAFAGKLIEDCGLRGFTVGGAQISEKHCGFVINRGGATCADVVALTEQVRQIVEARTGFVLEREIRVVK